MQRGQPVTPQDLYARHGASNNNTGELDGCEKLSASTFIELLGLINASPGVARPTFDSTIVTEFYRESQDTVVDIATSNYRADILGEMRDGRLFDHEAKELLTRYGPRIWGTDRSHLMDARKAPTDLYAADLYFDRPEDYRKIVFWVRCWMAKRALRKASEAGKKGSSTSASNNLNTASVNNNNNNNNDKNTDNAGIGPVLGTPGTPKKRKRQSPSARKQFHATDSAPMQSLDPPKRKRGRPRRIDYHQVNYGESSASDEPEQEQEQEQEEEPVNKKANDQNVRAGAEQSPPPRPQVLAQALDMEHREEQLEEARKSHDSHQDQEHLQRTADRIPQTASTWREPSPVPDHLTPTNPPTHQIHHRRDVPTMSLGEGNYDGTRSRSSSVAARATKVVRLPVAKAKLTVFEAWEGWKEMAKHQPDGSFIIKEKSVPSTPALSNHHIDLSPSLSRFDSTQSHPKYQPETKTEQHDTRSLKSADQALNNASSTTNLPSLGFRAINHTIHPSASVSVPSSSPNPSNPNTLAPMRPTAEQALPIHPHSLPPLSLPYQPTMHSPPSTLLTTTTVQSNSPEETNHLRRQVLSTLLTLLSSSTSSDLVLTTLQPLLNALRPHLQPTTAMTPSHLATLTATFATWSAMHSALSDFRRIAGYVGRSGEEWQVHRRGLTFRDRVVVMEAENRLGTWRLDKRRDGRWVDEDEPKNGDTGRGLDRELAELFELVLGGVGGVGREDLLDGLGEYNGELLSWFR